MGPCDERQINKRKTTGCNGTNMQRVKYSHRGGFGFQYMHQLQQRAMHVNRCDKVSKKEFESLGMSVCTKADRWQIKACQ